jgi:exopolyphosphatase/guanosine-5'-triphosphate,3'-diphosphate pyrophosphatase
MHISYERHHRHSYYIIKNGDLRGFEPDEITVIALIARYHRRATPSRRHEGYGDLPRNLRNVVKVLSAFLRVAEALDRSRNGVIDGVAVNIDGRDVAIVASGTGDCELELWAANRQLFILAHALDSKVTLTVKAAGHDSTEPRTKKKRASSRAA